MLAPAPNRSLARPRLHARLDAAVDEHALTMVAAPAGWGKTTLLSAWAARSHPAFRAAWVPLDAHPYERNRFWRAVLDDLRAAGLLDGTRLADLEPGAAPGLRARLVRGFRQLPAPIVLVIDDLHRVPRYMMVGDVWAILRSGAPVRVLGAARGVTRFAEPRVIVNGEARLVGPEHLALGAAEIAELADRAGHRLAGVDRERLLSRTGGWPAAVAAVIDQLSVAGPIDAAVEHALRSGRFAAYLDEQLIADLDDRDRRFVLRCTLVPQICADLAAELTGRADAPGALAGLVDRGVARASGHDSRHYVLHPLLREAVALTRPAELPTRCADLLRRTARWLVANGSPVEAFDVARAADDPQLRAEVVRAAWPALLGSHAAALRDVVYDLPESMWHHDARLMFAVGTAHIVGDANDEMTLARLRAAHELLAGVGAASPLADVVLTAAVVQAICLITGDVARAVAEGERAWSELGPRYVDALDAEPAMLALFLRLYGQQRSYFGDLAGGGALLRRAVDAAREAEVPYWEFGGLAALALTDVVNRGPRLAEPLIEQAFALAEPHWLRTFVAAPLHLAVAMGAVEAGRPDRARGALDSARGVMNRRHLGVQLAHVEALTCRQEHRHAAGLEALDRSAEQGSDRAASPAFRAVHTEDRVRLLLAIGHHDEAAPLLDELADVDRHVICAASIRALVELTAGDPARALDVLSGCLEMSDHWPRSLIDVTVVAAVAEHDLQRPMAAARRFHTALRSAHPIGVVRPFLDVSPRAVTTLLQTTQARYADPDLVAFCAEIRAALDARAQRHPARAELSRRERAVLEALLGGGSVPQIAAQLAVSPNTVKTQLRHLYRKLHVGSRAEAVEAAVAGSLLTGVTPTGPLV